MTLGGTTASVILSPRTAVDTGEYGVLSDPASLKKFVSSIAGHKAVEAERSC